MAWGGARSSFAWAVGQNHKIENQRWRMLIARLQTRPTAWLMSAGMLRLAAVSLALSIAAPASAHSNPSDRFLAPELAYLPISTALPLLVDADEPRTCCARCVNEQSNRSRPPCRLLVSSLSDALCLVARDAPPAADNLTTTIASHALPLARLETCEGAFSAESSVTRSFASTCSASWPPCCASTPSLSAGYGSPSLSCASLLRDETPCRPLTACLPQSR